MIVWGDTETTGLDEKKGQLLEVALIMSDDDLKEGLSISVVCQPPSVAVAVDKQRAVSELKMDDVVREMHTKNGLLAEVATSELTLAAAEDVLCAWFKERCASPGTIPLAGSTIGFDRRWLRHHMPKLDAMFSYRSIDVSGVTEIARRWNRDIYDNRPKGNAAHRALDDARESIEYLRYYRRSGFIGS